MYIQAKLNKQGDKIRATLKDCSYTTSFTYHIDGEPNVHNYARAAELMLREKPYVARELELSMIWLAAKVSNDTYHFYPRDETRDVFLS